MVKSMLDLRQLETFAHKKTPNFPPHDRERQSTSSLQEPMVCMDLCLRDNKRDLSCMNPCVWNCSAMSPIIFCSCSWRREPRGIGPGRTLTGCPRTRPRASGGLMELCFTLKRMRAIWVYRAGKPHALCSWFHSSDHNDTEREQKCFSILGSMFPSSPVPHCFRLSLSLSVFPYVSDYMVKEQHCRMQGRGIRSESQESRSADSACSLGYDSRESSPDRVLDGEVLLWWQQARYNNIKKSSIKIIMITIKFI